MSILLVGAQGNMGRRYTAALRSLGHEPTLIDTPWPDIVPDWTHALVAAQTGAHWAAITDLIAHTRDYSKPRQVLLEKPVAKSVHMARAIHETLSEHNMRLCCVNQYQYLPGVIDDQETRVTGISLYDYFSHGKDGLEWDCFQLYALARGEIQLFETSPVWRCVINGRDMNLCDMDYAYLHMLEDWLGPQKYVWRWPTIQWATARICVALARKEKK